MPDSRDYFWQKERSTPIQARGGIKAQSKSGRFGATWWSRRWIEVLESFHLGTRLTRGRSYARRGQVLAINITAGEVRASVQGSRAQPYAVNIKIKEIKESDWEKLSQSVFNQALIASKLLAGEMPDELENCFKSAGVALFPQKYNDLKTECSCPDWSNPCKHIAAVYYLLAEEFERSPFLLLTLRGLTEEKLFQLLGASDQAGQEPGAAPEAEESAAQDLDPSLVELDLPSDLRSFWASHEDKPVGATLSLSCSRSSSDAALTKQLGSPPFWRGEENFQTAMERIYSAASRNVMSIALQDKPGKGAD
ncbi:MAG TPA: SWIM zinc finger family protein [Trichormus sp.]|jgi:uncharacterized Zn finger protein